ncbi:MAG: DUF1641 domain-containing protein [Bacteroidales bacterium]|nr:DUF1641 domain-containing protein [Bacteroidales bacterium]
MDDKNIQTRIDALDAKLDLVLEYVNQQRLKSDMLDDLVADISIVGKDIYDTSVAELENQAIEIDPDELKALGLNLVRNIGNINDMLVMFGSVLDLMKDAGPIVNEVIIDFSKKLHEFEEKRYFEFFAEIAGVMDKVITNFSLEEMRKLGDNVVLLLDVVKNLTQPAILEGINNTLKTYNNLDMNSIPQYSIFRVMKELRTPEMKSGLGFMITFLKSLATANK